MATRCGDNIFQIGWCGEPGIRGVSGSDVRVMITVSLGTFTIRRNGTDQDIYTELLKTKHVPYEIGPSKHSACNLIQVTGLPAELILLYIKGDGYADLTLSEYLDKLLASV